MDIYTTGAIAATIRAIVEPKPFLLETFFRNVITSQTEEILFDVEIKRRRVAPFVAPHVPGKLVASPGYRTDRFTPAMIKDLRQPDINRPLKRAIGEQVGGAPAMTPLMREAAILKEELTDQKTLNTRRLELMAADALDDGILTVTGEGYPAVNVDFTRPGGHTVTLAGAARWGQAGISPVANLITWRQTFLQNSGLPATDIVMTPDAWAALVADPLFKTAVDTTLRGTAAQANFIPEATEGGELVGYLNTTTRLWTYMNWYVDPADDTEKSVLAAGTVLMGNNSPDGSQTRAFGAIPDAELGYPSVDFAAKSWVEKNPGQRQLLAMSAPLMVLSRPAATFRARVL